MTCITYRSFCFLRFKCSLMQLCFKRQGGSEQNEPKKFIHEISHPPKTLLLHQNNANAFSRAVYFAFRIKIALVPQALFPALQPFLDAHIAWEPTARLVLHRRIIALVLQYHVYHLEDDLLFLLAYYHSLSQLQSPFINKAFSSICLNSFQQFWIWYPLRGWWRRYTTICIVVFVIKSVLKVLPTRYAYNRSSYSCSV